MKTVLFAVVAALGLSAAHATDLSSVGTVGAEVGVDYNYVRNSGSDSPAWLSQHQASLVGQLNLGSVGSFALSGGDRQTVSGPDRLNQTVFGAAYAHRLGSVLGIRFTGEGSFDLATGDKWVPFAHGQLSSTAVKTAGGTVEASFGRGAVQPFVDFTHSYSWNDSTSFNSDAVAAGVYVRLNKTFSIKAGWQHTYSDVPVNGQGAVIQVNAKL